MGQLGLVYTIHLEVPLCHARHYVGWTASPWHLSLRLAHHRAGNGSRLLAAVTKAGIRFVVADVQPGTRADERRKKDRKDCPRTCQLCRGQRLACFDCGRLYRFPGWLTRHQAATGHR
jgi:hypothetical protein